MPVLGYVAYLACLNLSVPTALPPLSTNSFNTAKRLQHSPQNVGLRRSTAAQLSPPQNRQQRTEWRRESEEYKNTTAQITLLNPRIAPVCRCIDPSKTNRFLMRRIPKQLHHNHYLRCSQPTSTFSYGSYSDVPLLGVSSCLLWYHYPISYFTSTPVRSSSSFCPPAMFTSKRACQTVCFG